MRQEIKYPKNGFVDNAQRLGHKVDFVTHLFGVEYAWMIDREGTHYLVRLDF